MSSTVLRSCVGFAALLTAGAAVAQQAQSGAGAPPAPVVRELVSVDPEWNKVCFNEPQSQTQVCQTARLFGDRADNPIISILVTDPGGPEKTIQLLAPMGVALRPGFQVAVDKEAPEDGAYELCTPQGAYGGLRVKNAFVERMKKGEKIAVSFKTFKGGQFTFNLPLAGFGKAFDGPGVDPKVAEERQHKLQEELTKKAEQERQKPSNEAESAPPNTASAAPAASTSPAVPDAALRQRQLQCSAEWKARKAEIVSANPNANWPQFWKECSKRLK